MSAFTSMKQRRSYSRVGGSAPDHDEILRLVEAAGTVADHGSLRPWRFIEIRGGARARLGSALAEGSGASSDLERAGFISKAERAPLLIAIVAAHKQSEKVTTWEQDAVAAGVTHALSLLLDEAGWGVIWRTGPFTRTGPVRRVHELQANEELLGWLYVGERPVGERPVGERPVGERGARRTLIDAADHVTVLS
ncbi:nitroreductase family protein [Subtercola frigoramans]|uniref:Putative NAD(P)H nitroreductase n=1 Tax=Subtercola frigoramans TaxID=120298 RepID=A0ABS2L323_9MICO|nr:nitroreductase family protein [Subtercola frigoramans]MBM7471482.1 nitroreductase [Subtercola frigoramans]